ncbi:hypothetical protein [Streptococcus sobrinus]|uniref:hypothetical protein n=1 Tax=Streptococcus sobrinus TaxID=1310 RepID=UPI000301F7C3|nr:hypothetical protein [Streptococcus sobrinus]
MVNRKDKLKAALNEQLSPSKRKAGRPKGKTKKPYSFTLKPANRDKLDRMAAQAGYTAVAAYLDDWIEHYDLEDGLKKLEEK